MQGAAESSPGTVGSGRNRHLLAREVAPPSAHRCWNPVPKPHPIHQPVPHIQCKSRASRSPTPTNYKLSLWFWLREGQLAQPKPKISPNQRFPGVTDLAEVSSFIGLTSQSTIPQARASRGNNSRRTLASPPSGQPPFEAHCQHYASTTINTITHPAFLDCISG